ncbi:MAG: anthranilate phosphoribosyltransferase [Methylococcaceae bacterium TMED69]|nr:MAG: anthranilate phosphoribosyltransferase [Methylococcaceae bacterium TMED69]|tara:strand:+ start:554 stop:1576 length:1023 start_codon:yes stop_codon:yes gene_type:complete
MIKIILKKLLMQEHLTEKEASNVFKAMINGELTDAQISCFLSLLASNGESPTEIAAAAKVMRMNCLRVPTNVQNLVDTCGTGGDNSNTFNVSTGAAFIAAAAGVKIAKHGNRSASSNSGSADLLEKAGSEINLPPDKVAYCIENLGIGFMFAPNYHRATKKVVAIRKELGIRTLFNLVGPLTNPAPVYTQVIGIFDSNLIEKYLEVLIKLDCKRAMVIASRDGLDEISVASNSIVGELYDKKYKILELDPEKIGIKKHDKPKIDVKNAEESLRIIRSVFNGEKGAAFDMLALNAAAVIYIGGISEDLKEGVEIAKAVIEKGEVTNLFNKYIETTKRLAEE